MRHIRPRCLAAQGRAVLVTEAPLQVSSEFSDQKKGGSP